MSSIVIKHIAEHKALLATTKHGDTPRRAEAAGREACGIRRRRPRRCYLCSAPPEKSMQLQGRGRGEISVGSNQSVSACAPPSVFPRQRVCRSSPAIAQALLSNGRRPPLPPPPPAPALLELLLSGQIRAAALTCLVRPNADSFLLAQSSRNQRPSKNRRLIIYSGSLSALLALV